MTDCPLCGHAMSDHDELILCGDTSTLIVAGRTIRLAPTELWILELLKSKYPGMAGHDELADYIWALPQDRSVNTLKVWMSKLRKHLRDTEWLIVNVWGRGYRLVRSGD